MGLSPQTLAMANKYTDDKNKKIDAQLDDIPKQYAKKSEVGSPLIASSISEMLDKTKVYVNTTDDNWYSWNGSAWVIGGKYNGNGIGERTVGLEKLSTASENLFEGEFLTNSAILLNADNTARLATYVNGVSIVIKVNKGIYKIKKVAESDRFRVVGMRYTPTFDETPVDLIYYTGDTLSDIEIEVPKDIKYLVIYVSGTNVKANINASKIDINKKYLDSDIVTKQKSNKNLYHGTLISGLIEGASINDVNGKFTTSVDYPNAKVSIIEIEPNETYTIKPYGGDRNRYVVFNTHPKLNSVPSRRLFVNDGNLESFTFTNDAKGKYLMLYLSTTGENVKCQIERGTQATTYEPYYFIDKSLLPEQEKVTQPRKFFTLGNPQLYFSTNTIDPTNLVTSDILAIYNSVSSKLVTKNQLGLDGLGNPIYEYIVDRPLPKAYITDGVGGQELIQPNYTSRMKMKILLNSGTHGDEKGSALGLALFFKDLVTKTDDETLNFIKNNATLKFIPVLNPSGYDAGTRPNHRGYDLNRDFINKINNETKIAIDWINNNADAIACLDYHNSSRTLSVWPAIEDQIYHEIFYNVISNLNDKWCQDNPTLNNPVGELMASPITGNMNTYAHRKGMLGMTVEGSRHSSSLNAGYNSNFDAMAVKYGNDLLVNTIVAIMMYSR